jgi:hypothetical protein
VVASYGKFLTTEQWFDDPNDPFNRAPSVISYDYETRQKVTQNRCVWIAGLSDEAGAGSGVRGSEAGGDADREEVASSRNL